MKKSFLGQGLAFPIRPSGSGGIALSSGEENIEEAIRIIIGTAIGERVMAPEFGCHIHDLIFHPNNATTASLASYHVLESLRKWEPRILDVSVRAYPDPSHESTMLIDVSYRVIQTNNLRNLVYPFYLRREQDL